MQTGSETNGHEGQNSQTSGNVGHINQPEAAVPASGVGNRTCQLNEIIR